MFSISWFIVLFWTAEWKEMLTIGFIFRIGGVVIAQEYALHDYWQPAYTFGSSFPIEDFLYGFFFGGTLASIHSLFHDGTRYKNTVVHFGAAIFWSAGNRRFFLCICGLATI